MDAVFFDGVVAGWALLAVGIAFKAFCLLDDVAHFAEEAKNVVLDDRCSVFQRCFVFRLAETVDGQFGAADALRGRALWRLQRVDGCVRVFP